MSASEQCERRRYRAWPSLTITTPLPVLDIRKKGIISSESGYLGRFWFVGWFSQDFFKAVCIAVPLDLVESQLYSPLSQNFPPPSPHSHPHLRIFCLRNVVRVLAVFRWEGDFFAFDNLIVALKLAQASERNKGQK